MFKNMNDLIYAVPLRAVCISSSTLQVENGVWEKFLKLMIELELL